MITYDLLCGEKIETEEYQGATIIPFEEAFIYGVDGFRYEDEPSFGAIAITDEAKFLVSWKSENHQ